MNPLDSFAIWVYLQTSPLFWLTATIGAYLVAQAINRRLGGSPLANPVAITILLLMGLLGLTGTSYQTFFDGAQFVHFLLGPATVALAVPLFDNVERVRRFLLPMAAAVVAGAVTGGLSAILLAKALGASRETMMSLAPKSVTSPIAMGVAEKIGGIPSLTAVMVILTGIVGAVIAAPLMKLLPEKRPEAQGLAIGIASHGIGTARAFQMHDLAGTFAGIGMALNGMVTPLVVPLLASWF